MLTKTVYAVLLSGIIASPVAAQDNTWSWKKVIPAGRAIEVRGVIGDITATPAEGNEVQVTARKRARTGDSDAVSFEVIEHDDGVSICVMYERQNTCNPGLSGNSSSHNNDTRVDFEVRVPRGVRLTAQTVIGDVRASKMAADVEASSVTGNVRVQTSAIARASTVSGSVHVQMGKANWTETLAFSSVSGNITIEFEDDLNSEVTMNTVSGALESEWPITMRGRNGSRNLRGTIGSGGRRLSLSTVSGDVVLRKSN
jgi:hypothetical protein